MSGEYMPVALSAHSIYLIMPKAVQAAHFTKRTFHQSFASQTKRFICGRQQRLMDGAMQADRQSEKRG
jgi:hypothetical protein